MTISNLCACHRDRVGCGTSLRATILILSLLIVIWTLPLAAQSRKFEWGGVHVDSLTGELSVENQRTSQTDTRDGVVTEDQSANEYSGKIDLNSTSHVLHPNFLSIDLGGSYSPGKQHGNYLSIP